MNYQQTIAQIYGLQEFAIKLGLENISAFASRLGNPHLKYPVIHIAGTNGKGSTAFFIHQLLKQHGLKSGLFTSPHLADYRERIRINDTLIDPDFIVDFWSDHKNFILNRKATFFDTTTAMAFKYFAEQNVDVAIIETGLGGRLDSTNIVQPQIVVLTPVDFDHQKQLGNTLTSIAREKAGIIKKGAEVFSAPQQTEVLSIFWKHCTNITHFHYQPDLAKIVIQKSSLDGMDFQLKLKKTHQTFNFYSKQVGEYQVQNLALALLTARYFLEQRRIKWSIEHTRHVFSTQIWPARLQTVCKSPRVLFDVSHNLAGIQKTIQFLKKQTKNKAFYVLLGLIQYKDFKKIVTFLSQNNLNIYITEPFSDKKLPAEILKQAFDQLGQKVTIVPDPVKAVIDLMKAINKNELLLVTGSHYLIGHLINTFKGDSRFSI